MKLHTYCLLLMPLLASAADPQLAGVSAAMRAAVERRDIAGAVTVVAAKDRILHCDAVGLASLTNAEPMRPDSVFWIASMTKPVTAVAVLMLPKNDEAGCDGEPAQLPIQITRRGVLRRPLVPDSR